MSLWLGISCLRVGLEKIVKELLLSFILVDIKG